MTSSFLTRRLEVFLILGLLACIVHCRSSPVHGDHSIARQTGQGDIANDAPPLSPSSSLRSVPLFCVETSRCKPLQMDRVFSYVHISKTGGASWITELLSLLPTHNVFPQAPTGAEHSVSFQNSLDPFDFLSHHLVSLRSPRSHVWSLVRFQFTEKCT
jgi:hypothetical protein